MSPQYDPCYLEAIARFHEVYARALREPVREPTAVTLATADARGQPSARTVLLKGADERGFVVYTNSRSRKGRDLAANPRAGLLFFWPGMFEQVITGLIPSAPSQSIRPPYPPRITS